jgi:iron complex outermembrane recepter protein
MGYRDDKQPDTGRRWLAFLCACLWSLPAAAQTDNVRDFDIAAQSLTSALLEFGAQTGYSIGFAEELTAGLQSPGVTGRFRPDQALCRLLRGSGLGFEFIDGVTIAVAPRDDVGETNDGPAVASASPAEAPPAETGAPRDKSTEDRDEPPYRAPLFEEVIVVGSQIEGSDVADALPVTVWNEARIDAIAAIDGGDLFRALPSAGAVNFNGIDTFFAGVNAARGDVASINLRSLGTGNTLVLLNGRRLVLHPGVQTEYRVPAMTANMNALPVNAISRIEVLRDGASAVYGADAVAGVVNTVLRDDYDGIALSLQGGFSEGTNLNETAASLYAGRQFNEQQSALQVMVDYTHRNGMDAAERSYSRSSDLRPLLAGGAFANDANFENSSVGTSWGQFQLPVVVQQNGVPLTSASGIFHLQPNSFDGCLAAITGDACLDDGLIDPELYADRNTARQLMPDISRLSAVLTARHKLNERAEVYGELLWYEARSQTRRGGSVPLTSTPITIPASNYWNPFGPVTFADGRPNPNRLPGIDAPPEGLAIPINSSFFGSFYRVADRGQRMIDVRNDSYRALAGARGRINDWHWDSAFLYSAASTDDRTGNRVSSTLFQRSLALDTPDAYNPFNGSGIDNVRSFIDGTPNPESVTSRFLIDVLRHNSTSLALADLKFSNPSVRTVRAGDIGAAVGAEVRRERFREDRDPRLDGSLTFTDSVTGETYLSDVMESSYAADASGSRNVISLFSEITVPLVGESMQWRFAEEIEVHLAARLERFSDLPSTLKPRLAIAWRTSPALLFRASYSEGVRVPNLPQINAGETRRVLGATDWYRCHALVAKGDIASLGACGADGVVSVESSRSGSKDLRPEEFRSMTAGLVVTPAVMDSLTLTLDYWEISQERIVGLFGAENHVAVDYVSRLAGSASPFVQRASVTADDIAAYAGSGLAPAGVVVRVLDPYQNLDRRDSAGLDLSLNYSRDSRYGRLLVNADVTRLLRADQALSAPAMRINELNEPAIAVFGGGDLLERDGRPRWRYAADLQWQASRWRAGISADYTASFYDTSAINDLSDEFFRVDDWLTVNGFAAIKLPFAGLQSSSLRVGVKNLFNREPPLADEAFGFNAALHNAYERYWYARLDLHL